MPNAVQIQVGKASPETFSNQNTWVRNRIVTVGATVPRSVTIPCVLKDKHIQICFSPSFAQLYFVSSCPSTFQNIHLVLLAKGVQGW